MNSKEVFAKFVELEQEIIRIKELNREMVEALKYIYEYHCAEEYDGCFQCPIRQILVKAEGDVSE